MAAGAGGLGRTQAARGGRGRRQRGATTEARQSRAGAAAVRAAGADAGAGSAAAAAAAVASSSRDESFSLFHSVGKLLYARPGSVDVEAVVAASAVQPLTILSFLQHNALAQLTADHSLQIVAQAEDAWSEADTASTRTRSLAFGDVTAAATQPLQPRAALQADADAEALSRSSRAEPQQPVRLHRRPCGLSVSRRREGGAATARCPAPLLLLTCCGRCSAPPLPLTVASCCARRSWRLRLPAVPLPQPASVLRPALVVLLFAPSLP